MQMKICMQFDLFYMNRCTWNSKYICKKCEHTQVSMFKNQQSWKYAKMCGHVHTLHMLWLIVSRMLHLQGPKLRTPPLSSDRHLQVQSVLDVGDNSMARLSWAYVVYEIVKSSEVKGLTPLVMDTYEPRHGYLQAQAMDTYKLKWCVSTIRNKFHLPHTLDFLDIHHFRWGRSWMSSGDGTSSLPFSHLIRLPARKLRRNGDPWQGSASARAWLQMDTGSQ